MTNNIRQDDRKGFLEKVENIDRLKVVSIAIEATTCTNNKW